MLGYEIDERLKISTSTTGNLYLFRRFGDGLYFTDCRVKLYDIYLLDTILEEVVDGCIKVLQILLTDTTAHIYAYDDTGCKIITAAHSFETRTTVGTHSSQFSGLRKNGCTEACKYLAIVNTARNYQI